MKVWKQRTIRFWLIVCLPLSSYFSYFAYDNHQSIVFWQGQTTYWLEEMKKERFNSIANPQEQFDNAINERDRSYIDREFFIKMSFFVLFFPVLPWLLYFISKFVLHGK